MAFPGNSRHSPDSSALSAALGQGAVVLGEPNNVRYLELNYLGVSEDAGGALAASPVMPETKPR